MGAKTDVMVKLVLVFFISLLSFSIGTFVGKKYSDNQHKLASLEPSNNKQDSHEVAAHSNEATSDVAKEHAEPKTGEAMSDEEIAKLAEEFVADDSTATTTTANHETEHKEEAATPKTRTLEKSEPLSAAKNIADGKAASAAVTQEKKIDTRIPSSIPKDISQYNTAGKFTVQVGAFAKEDEAQKIAGDLKSKGFSAFYIPATVKGQTWFRVSVGLFATPKEAQDYRNELMGKTKLGTAIVQKIIQ